jgi:YVTN family beta-propeller protein
MNTRQRFLRWSGLIVILVLLLGTGITGAHASQAGTDACYPTVLANVGVQSSPHGVAINLALKRLYVANHDGDTLSIVDSTTYAVVKTISAGDGPNGVAYNSKNGYIYIADRNTNKVRVINAGTYAFVKDISVGSQPDGVAANNVSNKIYVANYGSGTVSIINGSTNTVEKTVTVGSEPANIAIDTGLNKAFVSLHGAGRIAAINSAGTVTSIDVYSQGPYGIAVDTVRKLVYVATIDTFRIAVVNASSNTFLGWAEIRRLPKGQPVPLRMIAVNPNIGSSGHIFVTTVVGDGGWNKVLTLPKGWPEYFARPYAVDANTPREGIVIEGVNKRVFVTARGDNKLAVFQDGEPICPTNFREEGYKVTVCVANPDGSCNQLLER